MRLFKRIKNKIRYIINKNKISKLKNIFNDTISIMNNNSQLISSIEYSIQNQECIPESKHIMSSYYYKKYPKPCDVKIIDGRTFAVAEKYKDFKICALNFACSTDPGGGVIYGSIAQEEGLCRCSTLYPCLCDEKMKQEFYKPHIKIHEFLSNDDCIFTPEVVVFKTDEFYPILKDSKEWFKVDIITCSAPDLHRTHLYGNSLYELHTKRLIRILDIAIEKKLI